MVQTQAVQPPCNSRATDGLETGRFGQERSGLRVSGNPDSIGLFGSGQVRPDPVRQFESRWGYQNYLYTIRVFHTLRGSV